MSERLSYKDIDPKAWKLISNGCGGKGSWIDPPDCVLADFTKPCDWHDFEYWRGGTEADRAHADRGMLQGMLDLADKLWGWRSAVARARAYAYYWAVRVGAGRKRDGKGVYFHYGPKRGLAELEQLLAVNEQVQAKEAELERVQGELAELALALQELR